MNELCGVIFSIVTNVVGWIVLVAAVFAPFGIVWLVLNH